MRISQRRERGGMPLWAVAAALISAAVSCVFCVAQFLFVFAPEQFAWVNRCLEWVSYVAFAAAPLLLVLGLAVSRSQNQ